ncbi:hypothetical protein Y887_15465 [Xanthomonas pisi DSM 18956]|nr:hypothetical protein Y887_15465 [Xanthomonas pisi DSM 18956]
MQAFARCVEFQRDIAFGSNTIMPPLALGIALILLAVRGLQRVRVQGGLHGRWHGAEVPPTIALIRSLIGCCNCGRTSGDVGVNHLGCLLVQRGIALRACWIHRPDGPIVPIDFVGDHPRPLATCRIMPPIPCVKMRSICLTGGLHIRITGLHLAKRLLGRFATGVIVQLARFFGQREHALLLWRIHAIVLQVGFFLAKPLAAVELPAHALLVGLRIDLTVVPKGRGLVGSGTEQITIGHHQRDRACTGCANDGSSSGASRPAARASRSKVQRF